MLLNLTDLSNEPLQHQIIRQVRARILAGALIVGDSLPSIRGLAREQHISVITVQRAYEILEREGLIAPEPSKSGGDWVYVTRRGLLLCESGDVDRFRAASLLPDLKIDPVLAAKARAAFIRGDYDTAVFEAFKRVETRVRELAKLDSSKIGVSLMREAFKPNVGQLTDQSQPEAEQARTTELYSGAIGTFKNPSSHRDVDFKDPVEVVELILFADMLIRIAERRAAGPSE